MVELSAKDSEVCKEDAQVLMLEKISNKFATKLVETGIISESDTDVYAFGFYQIVMLLLNVVTTLILGAAFQCMLFCILLNVAYIPIRVSAGGHHADNPVKCYIHSALMITVLLAIIKWINISTVILVAMLVSSTLVILIHAPVETENNPLDEAEQKVYRRRTIIVLIIELMVCLFCFCFSKDSIVQVIALALLTESVMLVAGKVSLSRNSQTYLEYAADEENN